MAIRVGMVSLGCPKNQMDAELMLATLEKADMELVADAALADVVIVNTCGFIESAKQEAIETILEFAQLKKEVRKSGIDKSGKGNFFDFPGNREFCTGNESDFCR